MKLTLKSSMRLVEGSWQFIQVCSYTRTLCFHTHFPPCLEIYMELLSYFPASIQARGVPDLLCAEASNTTRTDDAGTLKGLASMFGCNLVSERTACMPMCTGMPIEEMVTIISLMPAQI